MSRATPMAPDERRQAIVEATLPLLLAHGPDISTREIARACGVAEGTIFRAFETKQDLIHATIHAALRPEATLERLAALPKDQTLAERVTAILELMRAEIARTRSLFAHLTRRDVPSPSPHAGAGKPWSPHGHVDNRALLSRAVVAALEPYRSQLAVPTALAARVLAALSIASIALTDDEPPTGSAELASVVLHGIAEGDS